MSLSCPGQLHATHAGSGQVRVAHLLAFSQVSVATLAGYSQVSVVIPVYFSSSFFVFVFVLRGMNERMWVTLGALSLELGAWEL